LIQKLKMFSSSSIETAAAGVTSPQIAQTCSSFAQNCGQFVIDKVAPVVTAAAVGLAGGVALSHTSPPEGVSAQEAMESKRAVISPVESAMEAGLKATKKHRKRAVQPAVVETEPTVAPSPVEPTPTSSPSAPPSDGGEGSGTDGRGNQPVTAPTPTGPPPFSAALGFGSVRGSSVYSNAAEVRCSDMDIEQTLSATMAHGDKTYGALLDLDAQAAAIGFDLSVYPEGDKYGPDVEYSGSGTRTSLTQNAARALLEYSGSYTNTDYDANRNGVPGSGTFVLRLELDCSASAIVDQTLQLSA
jgi:hypothetical protein